MGELRGSDLDAVREQLGREPTTPFTVVARCSPGHPLVIRNAPLDAEGHPFPTLFWLTCPDAVKAVSRVESEGWIAQLNERIDADAEFAQAVERRARRVRGGARPRAARRRGRSAGSAGRAPA